MKLLALTREPATNFDNCELTFLERIPIDVAKAKSQHEAYRQALQDCGAEVIHLENKENLPDAVFIEDPAVVVDELAVLTRMAATSRAPETAGIEKALQHLARPLKRMEAPGTLDGGDVLRIGKTLYVGLTARTNLAGAKQLRAFLDPYGYEVVTTEVRGALHLKTGCSYVGRNTLLVNPKWVTPMPGYEVIEIDPSEPFGANALLVGSHLIHPMAFPRTRARLEARGIHPRVIDISEFGKAEAGLTCMSQLIQ